MIRLNARKQGEVPDSPMNEGKTHCVIVVAIQEQHAQRVQGQLLTARMLHYRWGRENMTTIRQGEVDQVIALVTEHAIGSLLPCGTKAW